MTTVTKEDLSAQIDRIQNLATRRMQEHGELLDMLKKVPNVLRTAHAWLRIIQNQEYDREELSTFILDSLLPLSKEVEQTVKRVEEQP